jgi:hypothetical protein
MGLRTLNDIRHDVAAKYPGIMPGNVKALDDALAEAQINGIRLAASVAGDYDVLSMHPYLPSECILGKLNVLKRKPRKNPVAAKNQTAICGRPWSDADRDSLKKKARKKLNFSPLVDQIFKEARVMAGSSWPSAAATKWAMNKLVDVLK